MRTLSAALSLVLLLGCGYAWYGVSRLRNGARTVEVQGLGEPPTPTGSASAGSTAAAARVSGSAQNLLIVGLDSRAGLTAAQKRYLKVGDDETTNTDTIMLVHVPADGSRATLISIPRDAWVHIPGHPDAKINAAYGDGYYYSGAQGEAAQLTAATSTLLATVKQLTGVQIDHYVQVGFSGFVDIVKQIGPIPVTLCRSVDDTVAYNRAHNSNGGSGFVMSAGHHTLDPQQALEFVRQRHNIPGPITDDLGRELRQRYFLSAAFQKVLSADVLLDPFRLRRLIDAVDSAFVFDNQHFDITHFAAQMSNLSAGNITGRSIPLTGPIVIDQQDALGVDPAAVSTAVKQAFGLLPTMHSSGPRHRAPRLAPVAKGCVY